MRDDFLGVGALDRDLEEGEFPAEFQDPGDRIDRNRIGLVEEGNREIGSHRGNYRPTWARIAQ